MNALHLWPPTPVCCSIADLVSARIRALIHPESCASRTSFEGVMREILNCRLSYLTISTSRIICLILMFMAAKYALIIGVSYVPVAKSPTRIANRD